MTDSRDLAHTHNAAVPESPACEHCRFSHHSDNYIIREARKQVECRFSSPIMVYRQSSCANWWQSGWPEVNRDASCGKFLAVGTSEPANADTAERQPSPREVPNDSI